MAFGKELKRIRLQSGLSGKKLSDWIGVHKERLKRWELNDCTPRFEDRLIIENKFQMTLEEIQKLDSIPKKLFEQYSNNVSLVTQHNINDVGLMSLFNRVDALPETDRLFFKKLISCFLKAKKWDDLPENTVFN